MSKTLSKIHTLCSPSLSLPACLPSSYSSEGVGYGVRSDSAAASARQATSHPIPHLALSHSVHSKAPSHLAHRQRNTAPHPAPATKFGKSLSRHSSRQPHPTNFTSYFTYKHSSTSNKIQVQLVWGFLIRNRMWILAAGIIVPLTWFRACQPPSITAGFLKGAVLTAGVEEVGFGLAGALMILVSDKWNLR